ncbi:MAG: hypothetical protein KatS3mg114_1123 [Planctomycetaceae bacterium]|nr:MAG: hypothetical protein KatS3mg114_1123 [Planctomycetaceae bacterium]
MTTPQTSDQVTLGPDGRTELGDFKLIRKLGQGGMGEVFLAHQISLDRPAALKVLAKHLLTRPDSVQRFYREARAMAKVDHPHAVRVYAIDQVEGTHYVAMEYVDGQSMQKWIDQLGQLSIGDALHVVLRCAEALEAAHQMNLVHRDIKPDNIMVTRRGMVKLSDFGLAKALDDEDMQMTQSGMGLGTPYYMAPEQARNAKHVDGRCDIYALGVTLYYFLTGKLPFMGNSAIEVIKAKEQGRYPSARKLNPHVPEKLDLIIDKMMAVKPEQRFKDITEVINHLTALGLENASLSFIEVEDKFVSRTGRMVSVSATAVAKPAPPATTAGATSTRTPTSLPQAETKVPSAESTGLWHVEVVNAQGRRQVLHWSTQQILNALKVGAIDNRARASRRQGEPLLPLAQFPEFEKAIQTLLLKKKAEQQGHKAKQLIDSYQSQERWWKIKKKLKTMFGGLMGLINFVAYLAVIAVALYAAWWGWMNYGRTYLQKIQPGQNQTAPSTPASSPAN